MAEETRHSVLFVCRRPPYPLDNGGRIRSFELLRGLARAFDTTVVTYAHDPRSHDGGYDREALAALLPGVEIVTVPGIGPQRRGGQALSLLRRQSWLLGRYHHDRFTRALRAVAAPSLVHFDDLGVALAAPLAGAFNVYSSHNVEAAILELQARVGSVPRRAFYSIEAAKVRSEEARVWRSVDLCLATSELDAATIAAGGAREVALCPNGVDDVAQLPPRKRAPGEPLRLLFVGSGSYAPYERGLAWMVSEVLPIVRERVPVVFDVVGQRPARPQAAEGVVYHGRVPSVEPYYAAADVVVVPVFEGSGTRLKVIEAAAYGRPVVSTRLGAEGLPLLAGDHFLAADDVAEFARAILRLDDLNRAGAPELERMVTAARAAILPLTWPRVLERLIALYRSKLDGRAAS